MIGTTLKTLTVLAPLLGVAVAAPAPHPNAPGWSTGTPGYWSSAIPGQWGPHGAPPSYTSAVSASYGQSAASSGSVSSVAGATSSAAASKASSSAVSAVATSSAAVSSVATSSAASAAATSSAVVSASAVKTSTSSAVGSLPTVDLGYEVHQAIAFNDTGAYYNFSNIRYAAPPTGANRFRAPQSPAMNRGSIQTGGNSPIVCPQASPSWIDFATEWITEYSLGEPINITLAGTEAFNASVTTANALTVVPPALGASEDCLFLDVQVPKTIFDNAQAKTNSTNGAAVLVWIYGGGYTAGSKAGSGDPAGILARSMTHGRDGVVFVALNYRLGAMGWLAGPTFQSNGDANAGLYDQRFALQWIQTNIHLFGGDPNRVTVIGESAGGGSIMHQITAYGGLKAAPFQQAIMQSPGFLPQASNRQLEDQYNNFLSIANVSNVDQLRNLSTEALQAANAVAVWQSGWGTFNFGPAVDGFFVPAMPGKLLLDGNFDKNLNIMVGHNLNEGLLFTDPLINDTTSFDDLIRREFPAAENSVINTIENVLYPASAFKDYISRIALIQSEVSFTCNTRYLDLAFQNKTYSYYFTVPPGLHGSDIPYTFYNGGSVVNATAAIALQDWITTFAETGMPSAPDVPNAPIFNMYGSNATVLNLAGASIMPQMDTVVNARCDFWQKALYV